MSGTAYKALIAGFIGFLISFAAVPSYAKDDSLISTLSELFKLYLPEDMTRNEKLLVEWNELYERCETSIVDGTPLNVAELEEYVSISSPSSRLNSVESNDWKYPKGTLVLEYRTVKTSDGIHRSCLLMRPSELPDFSSTELRDIIAAFLIGESEALRNGTKILKRVSRESPEFSIWVRRVGKNSNGFCVTSRFAANMKYMFAFAGVSEVDEADCHASAPRELE